MVKSSVLYKILLPVFLLSAPPALAADAPAPLHFVGRYDFDWGEIPLGTLVLAIDDDKGAYRLRLQVASGGIVNLFTKHSSDTIATGMHLGGVYSPRFYESHYKTKNKPRHIKITYDDKGVVTEDTVEPPEDPTERPVVPHKLKDGSYDPLVGMMVMRDGVHSLSAYDAKHLYRVDSAPQEKVGLRTPAGRFPSQPYLLTRTPLAGLTARELKEVGDGDPPLTLYFSDDARRIPLGVRVSLFVGRVRGILVKECATWDECKVY